MNLIVEEVEADVRSLDIGVVWSRPFLATIVSVAGNHSVVEDEHWWSGEEVVSLVWQKRVRVRQGWGVLLLW